MKKAGKQATGILVNVAKTAGFDSVSQLLERNPNAQALRMTLKAATESSKRATAGSRKRNAPEESTDLVDDADLAPRKVPLPSGAPLAVHKTAATTTTTPFPAASTPNSKARPYGTPSHAPAPTPGGSAKRQRGPAWLDSLPAPLPLPLEVDAGELACILEFVAVFGCSVLELRSPLSLSALAAEMIQRPALHRTAQLCPVPEDSIAAAVHVKLLEVVRRAWGVPGPPVGLSRWQEVMREYYAAERISKVEAAVLREEQGPPALAGELIDLLPLQDEKNTDENIGDDINGQEGNNDAESSLVKHDNENDLLSKAALASAAAVEFPEGGYWGIDPGTRIHMLYSLVHDALDTYPLRDAIEKSMEEAAEGDKERRMKIASARKAVKEAVARQMDVEIAALMGEESAKGMSLEEQREIMKIARENAEKTAATAATAKLQALSQVVHPPTVRTAPLGQDRDGIMAFKLQSGCVLTGSANGLVLCRESSGIGTGMMSSHADPAAVAAALDPKGRCEGPLRQAIAAACDVPLSPKQTKSNSKASTPAAEKKRKGGKGTPTAKTATAAKKKNTNNQKRSK